MLFACCQSRKSSSSELVDYLVHLFQVYHGLG